MKKKPIKINAACGVHLFGGFINIDNFFDLEDLKTKKNEFVNAVIEKDAEFIKADVRKLPFADNYADHFLSVDTIEHLPFKDIYPTLLEWKRVLKPGGKLIIQTVNFSELAKLWTEFIEGKPFDLATYTKLGTIIYGNQVTEGEYHTAPITPEYMNVLLKNAGFSNYKILLYPTGSPCPKLDGYPWDENSICLTEMLVCDIIK